MLQFSFYTLISIKFSSHLAEDVHKVYESGAIENFLSVNAQKKNEITLLQRNLSFNDHQRER